VWWWGWRRGFGAAGEEGGAVARLTCELGRGLDDQRAQKGEGEQSRGNWIWNLPQSGRSIQLAGVLSDSLRLSARWGARSNLIAVPALSSHSTLSDWLPAGRARVCNSCTHSTHSTRDHPNLHARRHHAPEATRLSRRTGSSFLHYPHEHASRISPERVNVDLILPFNAPSPVTQQKSFQQRKAYRIDFDQCACTVETAYRCRLFEPRDSVTRHRSRNHSPEFLYLTLTLNPHHVLPGELQQLSPADDQRCWERVHLHATTGPCLLGT
jgi:hypothetical protein